METSQPWAADWLSWKIPNVARELIWATIVRRGLSSVRADNKKPQPKPGLVQRERRTGRSSWEAQRPAQTEVKFGFVAKLRGISANTLGSSATQLPNGKRTPAGSPLLPESWWFRRRPRKPESRWRLSQYLILTRGPRAFLIWPPCSGQPAGRATTSGAPKILKSLLAQLRTRMRQR